MGTLILYMNNQPGFWTLLTCQLFPFRRILLTLTGVLGWLGWLAHQNPAIFQLICLLLWICCAQKHFGKTPAMQSFSKWGVFSTSKRMHGKTPWWPSLRRCIWFAMNVLWQQALKQPLRVYFPDCSVTALLLFRGSACFGHGVPKCQYLHFFGGPQHPAIKKLLNPFEPPSAKPVGQAESPTGGSSSAKVVTVMVTVTVVPIASSWEVKKLTKNEFQTEKFTLLIHNNNNSQFTLIKQDAGWPKTSNWWQTRP